MPVESPDYVTLTAMITPALFMTANGSLIISTSNRMSRIVDRIRVLNELSDVLCRGETKQDFAAERLQHYQDQLRQLLRRADLIRISLIVLYMAFGSFVGTSLAISLDVQLGHSVAALPTALAITGVCLLFLSAVNLVREALTALRGNRDEIRFYQGLRARRCPGNGSVPEGTSTTESLPS